MAKAKYLRWGLPVEPKKVAIEQEWFLFSLVVFVLVMKMQDVLK